MTLDLLVVGGADQLIESALDHPDQPLCGPCWVQVSVGHPGTLRVADVAALLKHPALVPLIVSKRSLGVATRMLDTSAARLMEEGVPSAAVMPLTDALEMFAIGSALHDAQGYPPEGTHHIDAGEYPSLAKAMAECGLSSDEIFDLVTASILDAIEAAVQERQARWLPANQAASR